MRLFWTIVAGIVALMVFGEPLAERMQDEKALTAATFTHKTSTPAPIWSRFMLYTKQYQHDAFRSVVNGTGHSCPTVSFSKFKHEDKNRTGYFVVTCTNGGNFMVAVKNDNGGSTNVWPCARLRNANIGC